MQNTHGQLSAFAAAAVASVLAMWNSVINLDAVLAGGMQQTKPNNQASNQASN